MKFSEIQDKQVVNIKDGTILGRVEDMDISMHNYHVDSFLVGKESFFLLAWLTFLFPRTKVTVHVDQIVTIGEDIILIAPRGTR